MENYKIALAQADFRVADLEGNSHKIAKAIDEAKSAGCRLVVFPELSLSGYPPGDFLFDQGFLDEVEKTLKKLATQCHGISAVVGTPRRLASNGNLSVANSAALLQDGQIEGYQDKTLLPNYGPFRERRFFTPGLSRKAWHIAGKKVAITICEDIWQHAKDLCPASYPIDPISEYQNSSIDFVLNLSASPFHLHKPALRQQVALAASSTLKCPLLLCNLVGGNDSLLFDGNSFALSASGLLAKAGAFKEQLLMVDLSEKIKETVAHEETMHTLHQALVMGLGDFCRKQGFAKAHLGLSGGIDSSVVACLAVSALGRENVQALYLPSRFSAEESRRGAEKLCAHLGIKLLQQPIDGLLERYLKELQKDFADTSLNAAEENLQARIRSNLLMAYANIGKSLMLNTGNKSELAMGYCTLYGDMAGAISVIGDLLKGQVYDLARWINREKEVIPSFVLQRPPTAELKKGQLDTDSLPPYPLLDPVLQLYLEKNLGAEAISAQTGAPLGMIEKILKQVRQNEFKRRQAPPILRISERCFSTDWVMPIAAKK